MADSSGKGLLRNVPRYAPWNNLFDQKSWPATARTVAEDWYFAGRGPDPVTEIPWTWLSGPLRFRPDSPINTAEVSTSGGATARVLNGTSVDEHGSWLGRVTTYADDGADAANLATWLVTYYTEPRVRLAQVRLILNTRTPTELRLILRREVGDRIRITGVPTGWPEGAVELVVEGIHHESAVDTRTVTWSAAPLIGENPDESGPWFRLGVSQLGGDDVLPW